MIRTQTGLRLGSRTRIILELPARVSREPEHTCEVRSNQLTCFRLFRKSSSRSVMPGSGDRVYPWMTKVFGDPAKTLAHLDRRRAEMLRAFPGDGTTDCITQGTVDEWMCLLTARNEAFRELLIDENCAFLLQQASNMVSTMKQLKKVMDSEHWTSFSDLFAVLQRFVSSRSSSSSPVAVGEPSSIQEEKWLENSYMSEPVSGNVMARADSLVQCNAARSVHEAGDTMPKSWVPNAVSTPLGKNKSKMTAGNFDMVVHARGGVKNGEIQAEEKFTTPPSNGYHEFPLCSTRRLDEDFAAADLPCISPVPDLRLDHSPLRKSLEKSQRSSSCPHKLSELSALTDLPTRSDTGMGSRLSFLGSSNSMCSVQVLSQRLLKNSWPKSNGMHMITQHVIPEKSDHNDSVD